MNDSAFTAGDQPLRRKIGHVGAVFLGFALLYLAFFSPALVAGKLLAPGDGLIFYVPAFYGAKGLWSNFILGGVPWAADPQNMTWYPVAMLLRWIPHSWNAFVLSAYVLAAVGAYAYVYTLTASWLAAAVAGMAYSLGGFMMSHLGHTTIIHAAAWMPLIICAIERLRQRITAIDCAMGLLAIVCCSLSGHPQIAVYALGLGLGYALVMGLCLPVGPGRWAYCRCLLGLYVAGLGLCAIQLLPMVELSRLSVRNSMTFEEFCGFAMPPLQLLQLIFPYLFGGLKVAPYYMRGFWGKSGLTEITGYIGLLPLMLAAIGVMRWRSPRPIVWFWLVVAIVATLLTLGEHTWLSHWLYHVPVYNKFRSPGRHFVEMNLAVSVLAGLGVAAIQRAWASKRVVGLTILTGAIVLLALGGYLMVQAATLHQMAQVIRSAFVLAPWRNAAIGLPLVIFMVGSLVLRFWARRPNWRPWGLVLLVVLFWDVSSFGWFYDWRPEFVSARDASLMPNAIVKQYRPLLQASGQRFMTVNGAEAILDHPTTIAPNLTHLWEFPSADGYGPLMLPRLSELMHMVTNGKFLQLPIDERDRGIDLMAVRYVLLPPGVLIKADDGMKWAVENLRINLGSGSCVGNALPTAKTLQLQPVAAPPTTAIAFVSQMGCSVAIPQAAAVLQVETIDAQGARQIQYLRAGEQTAEVAYDCADVQPTMQHQRVRSWFRSFPIVRPSVATCDGHEYVGILPLERPQTIRQINLKWLNYPGSIMLQKISLLNPAADVSQPLFQQPPLTPTWQPIEQRDGGTIYENPRALPRTWLVGETMQLTPAEILQTIHRSQLPNGQPYDPLRLALVEDAAAGLSQTGATAGVAAVMDLEPQRVAVRTSSPAAAFLVLSDVFYPGWQATIDGKPTQIFPTNYVQRGVQLPAGDHVVEFKFAPLSFKLGAGITLLTLWGSLYGLWRIHRSAARSNVRSNARSRLSLDDES